MKDQETQQRFIQLRAQGWTFKRIAGELNASKGTLIAWSRKFRFEIQNHRAIELEALRDQLVASREARARLLGQRLNQVTAELATRDLSDVSTSRLFELEASLHRQIVRETGELSFTAPLKEIPEDEYHEHVQDWSP